MRRWTEEVLLTVLFRRLQTVLIKAVFLSLFLRKKKKHVLWSLFYFCDYFEWKIKRINKKEFFFFVTSVIIMLINGKHFNKIIQGNYASPFCMTVTLTSVSPVYSLIPPVNQRTYSLPSLLVDSHSYPVLSCLRDLISELMLEEQSLPL